ncbi:MAG TPA: hypothetical protein ACHBZA_04265, partial [Arsenophonus apicola]
WGKHSIETGYLARIPVHPVNTKVREYDVLLIEPLEFRILPFDRNRIISWQNGEITFSAIVNPVH